MKILFIFEFGFPPYRQFLFNELKKHFNHIKIVAGQDKFKNPSEVTTLDVIFGSGETVLYKVDFNKIKKADVVISSANLRRPHTWIGIFLFPRKKWILWGQGVGRNKSFLMKWLRNQIYKRSDRYIVYTKSGRDKLVELGYPAERIFVANNTLQVANSELTPRGSYLLYVGRLQARKDVELIFPYLKKLNIPLRIVGSGEHKARLHELVDIYGVNGCVEFFHATHDETELKEHFAGALAYFSPGHVGLGVVHAFSYGVPVITLLGQSHAPEFEYCDVNNSYLLRDKTELYEGVLAVKRDRESHKEKCINAYRTYTHSLSPEHMVNSFIDAITSD